MKFKRRTYEIDAFQWTREVHEKYTVYHKEKKENIDVSFPKWLEKELIPSNERDDLSKGFYFCLMSDGEYRLMLRTSDDLIEVSINYWIVKNKNGTFYFVNDRSFRKRYEEVK